MQTKRYTVAVNLVTHNGAQWLPYCLESLVQQTWQDFFMLVIDNGSADKSVKIVEEFLLSYPELAQRSRLVINKLNLGFARAHNQAIMWTNSEFVMVLNQDLVLDSGYLEHTTQALEANPRIGAVTGKLLQWQFNPDTFHLGELAKLTAHSSIDAVGLNIHRSRRVTNLGQGEVNQNKYWDGREVFGVPGTAPLYRRGALAAVSPGGLVFDENFVSYKEDVDLAWRLRLADWSAWYVPSAVALHDRSLRGVQGDTRREHMANRRNWSTEHELYSWVNHLAVLLKHDSALNLTYDLPWVMWHELQKFVYLLVLKPVVLLRGLARLARLYPAYWRERRLLKPTRQLKPTDLRRWWKRE